MDLAAFRRSLADAEPPAGIDAGLAALWWDAKGDWHRAHEFAQRENTQAGWAIHAYLHRKEGDLPNARYWYARAGKEAPTGDLDTGDLNREWTALASDLLQGRGLRSDGG